MDRYSTNNKGLAPALSDVMNEYANAPRSGFDESSRKGLDVSPFYIIPFDITKVLPNTDVNISYDISVINKTPTIRRMLSSMSLETRTYFVKDSDCWEGFNNHVTCGRSGKISKQIPRLKWRLSSGRSTCLPYNPYFMLNIAPARYLAKSTDDEPSRRWSFEANQGLQELSNLEDSGLTLIPSTTSEDSTVMHEVSALPGVFYCKIAQEYQNPNLLQDNPFWYPENENDNLVLPYTLPNNADSVTNATMNNCTDEFGSGSDKDLKNSISPTNDKHSMPWLNVLYRCQRKGNYFNTGSPFPNLLRGDVPTLSLLDAKLDFSNSVLNGTPSLPSDYTRLVGVVSGSLFSVDKLTNKAAFSTPINSSNSLRPDSVLDSSSIVSALNKGTISGLQFSLSSWRRLAVMTLFREKMARTDGSYNQMIQAQFGINPNWHEHSPIYIGGSYQPIVFSEVIQTSGDADTPLGTTAGRFVSANQNNQVSFHSNDFGMIMSVLTIVPDDYYCQGINRLWSALDNADIPFPIMNNLDPQAILNKELIVSGNNNNDNDVLAYAERYSEWKSQRNEIAGLLALPVSKVGDIGTYFFNRLLGSVPQFNWSFVEGRMTDNENLAFSSSEQAQFILSIARNKHVVYPLPTVSHPSDMGISYA